MPEIFISYRRSDAMQMTDRIHEYLCSRFGAKSVVRDIDSIPLGEDFRSSIETSISNSDIVLAVIGKQWLCMEDDSVCSIPMM